MGIEIQGQLKRMNMALHLEMRLGLSNFFYGGNYTSVHTMFLSN